MTSYCRGPGGDSWWWFVPGLIIQMALFGTSYAGYVLMSEIRSGVLERFQVTPISRVALLFGRVLRDVCVLVVQCGILLAFSTAFGFRASALQVLLMLLFGALTGIAIAAASHTLALKAKHEYVFGPLLGGTVTLTVTDTGGNTATISKTYTTPVTRVSPPGAAQAGSWRHPAP